MAAVPRFQATGMAAAYLAASGLQTESIFDSRLVADQERNRDTSIIGCMSDGLDLSSEEFYRIAEKTIRDVCEYFEGLENRSITPEAGSVEIRTSLRECLPAEGCDPDVVLDVVRRVVIPGIRHNSHPRFFGYVASPGTPMMALGAFVAAALNANLTAWRSGPSAVEMEHLAIDWIKEMIGYAPEAAGLFVSGGSMANFAGMAAARSRLFPDVKAKGMPAAGGRARIYASEDAHFSAPKAASMLGIGADNVQAVATDSAHRMDAQALSSAINADLQDGLLPMCIVATAGTVSTGAIDPLEDIAEIARSRGVWLHVDGCYGGFAALAPSVKHAFAHLREADSIALDPHKWLGVPVDCGCVLYRDGMDARRAFSHEADYIRPVGYADAEAFAFWDYGPELSRRFRALNVWMQVKLMGVAGLGAAIEKNIQSARYFAGLVDDDKDFEMLAPVELSIFCFRYAPRGFSGNLDALNERVMLTMQRRGSSYLSNALVRGRFALRGCVLNPRTEDRHMRELMTDVRAAAAAAADGT